MDNSTRNNMYMLLKAWLEAGNSAEQAMEFVTEVLEGKFDIKLKVALKEGDLVRLREDRPAIGGEDKLDNTTATITVFLSEPEGGVFLQAGLRGSRFWNVEDLEKVD